MENQAELFEAETQWFHVFKAMIDSGELANMEGATVKAYLVVKAHTNFSTGRAFPAIETIAQKAGLSERQAIRCLKALEEMGYIAKEKKGRRNEYTLREKVQIHDEQGRPSAVATWDYLPSTVQHAVADLKNVLVTGDIAGARIVHIERLHVQVINGSNNTGMQVNEAKPDMSEETLLKLAETNPAMFEKVVALRARARAKREAAEG